MAARANLKVTSKLSETFVEAQAGKQRYLIVKIKEEKLVFHQQSAGTDNRQKDFDSLAEKVDANEAAFILFQNEPSKWVFIPFVSDSAPVREKMLYASSTDDLIDQLGKQFFIGTHKCSEKSELSFKAWNFSRKATNLEDVMTAKEKLLREESLMDKTTCATGMKKVPFKLLTAASDALKELLSGSRTVVEMKISKKEKCRLGESKADAAAADVASTLKDPRYLVVANSGSAPPTFSFVFYCPDDAKPLQKMLYATAKSAILTHVEDHGLTVAARVEIAAGSELKPALAHALADKKKSAAQSHTLSFAKPAARKRRGGRRGLIKKPGSK